MCYKYSSISTRQCIFRTCWNPR